MQSEEAIIRSSSENVIELVKEHRDELIHRIKDEVLLKEFLFTEFNVKSISAIKVEFIKRALGELASTPIDLSHYATLILDMRKKDTFYISNSSERLFKADIERTIKNYL